MELRENDRRALAEAALIGGNEFRWKSYRLRCMTLGSMMQLQRIGNPYSRLGEINLAPDENGRHPSMWEALGVTDKAQIVYYLAEFLWVHMGNREEVKEGVFAPEEERRALVEAAAMNIPGRDLVELECAVLGDIEVIQAGMVFPEQEGKEEEDPLGRGRPGERPC